MVEVLSGVDQFNFDPEQIPSPPGVIFQVLSVLEKDEFEITELVELVEAEPALALKFIQLANSSFVNLISTVTTLEQALVVIGEKAIKLVALSIAVSGLTSSHPDNKVDNQPRERSALNAFATRMYLQSVDSDQTDEGFITALFGHLGEVAMSTYYPELYLKTIGEDGYVDNYLSVEQFGLTPVELTHCLLRQWGLYTETYDCLLQREKSDESEDELAIALRFSLLLEKVLFSKTPEVYLEKLDKLLKEIGCSLSLSVLVAQLEEQNREIAQIFNFEQESVESYSSKVEEARLILSKSKFRENLERNATQTFEVIYRNSMADVYSGKVIAGILMIHNESYSDLVQRYDDSTANQVMTALGKELVKKIRRKEYLIRYSDSQFALFVPEIGDSDLNATGKRLTTLEGEGRGLIIHGDHVPIDLQYSFASTDEVLEFKDFCELAQS